MNPENLLCPHCGKPVSLGSLMGLCPSCLLTAGLASATGDVPQGASASGFEPPSPEELGQYFPQLEILELLGRGGMGAVYKARQKELDRIVALKILPPGIGHDRAFAERFTREAKALAKLNHPHIVTLYDFGQVDGLFYFFMEYVDGVNLRQLLSGRRMSPSEALAIVPQICEALQFAHDRGIIHRDIKPENILLGKDGQVKIADFGVAKIVAGDAGEPLSSGAPPSQPEITESGRVLGTPQYMAPEQASHPLEVDHRADIYSLGVVFYQMLTGELPGKRIERPSRKVQIDVRLDEVVLRALEEKPERRYQQASTFKTQVETLATEIHSAPPTKRLRTAGALGLAALLAALLLTVFISFRGKNGVQQERVKVEKKLKETRQLLDGSTVAIVPELLATLEQDGEETTINRFLEVDWSARPLFTPGSLLSLSEDEFTALPIAEREAKPSEILVQLGALRKLVTAVDQAGVDAATKQDFIKARRCFDSLKSCGRAFDNPGTMLIVRFFGQAVEKKAIHRLANLNPTEPAETAPSSAERSVQVTIKVWPGGVFSVNSEECDLNGLYASLCKLSIEQAKSRRAIPITANVATGVDKSQLQAIAEAVKTFGINSPEILAGKMPPFPVISIKNPHFQFRLEASDKTKDAETFVWVDGHNKIRLEKDVLLDEGDIASAAWESPSGDRRQLRLNFTISGMQKFGAITDSNKGRRLAIVFDGRVLSAPSIQSAIFWPSITLPLKLTNAEEQALLDTLNHREASSTSPAPSATPALSMVEIVAQPPQLRAVNWQDWVESGTGTPWLPSAKVPPLPAWMPPIVRVDISKAESTKEKPRFLCLWFSHPLFNTESIANLTLLDADGKAPLKTPSGNMATQFTPATFEHPETGWLTATICAGSEGHIPPSATVSLRYSVGPWQIQDGIAADFRGTKALSTGVKLNAPGQDADGHAFILITRDKSVDPANEQFDFVAFLHDGQRLEHNGITRTNSSAASVEQFTFNTSLSKIEAFECRKRPIRTFTSKTVLKTDIPTK